MLKIEAITEKTLVLGIDAGSEMHYTRAFDYKGSFQKTKNIVPWGACGNGVLRPIGLFLIYPGLPPNTDAIWRGSKSFSSMLRTACVSSVSK